MTRFESLPEEFRLLDDTATRFAERHAAPVGMPGPAPDLWPELLEMGLVGLALPETRGGAGVGAMGALTVGRALGARAVPVCFPLSAVLVPALLDALGLKELRDEVLCGKSRAAVSGGLLPAAPGAEAAGLAFGPADPDVLLVPGDVPDCLAILRAGEAETFPARMADGRPIYRIRETAAENRVKGVAEAMAAALPVALVAAAAEMLGAMETLLERTLEHLRLRRQFGQPLGRFQALQFRMVDVSTAVEEALALAMAAAQALDEARPDAPALAHAAWIQAIWSGRVAVEEAIQMHGAIGMTAECELSVLVRRVLIGEQLFGPAEPHLARYRALVA